MRRRFAVICTCILVVGLVLGTGPHSLLAAENIGWVDFSFGTSAGDDPTADKPQSKLWHNDGFWWAVMFHTGSGTYHIYRLSSLTQPSQWIDTGVVVDDRPLSRADCLWDGTHLYVASTKSKTNVSDSANQGRLYRYSYANGVYTLDSGFPVVMFTGVVESTTIDKDSTGQLWVTFTKGSKVYVNRSTTNDATWGTPFVVPGPTTATNLASDDISSLVAYNDQNGSSIGVLWSNHNSPSSMYFAYHKDSDPDLTWQPIQQIYTGTCAADDHINLKSLQTDPSGAIYAAVKTSFGDSGCGGTSTSPLIRLVVRKPNNSWAVTTFGTVGDDHTRPLVLLDTSNRKVYMFATAPTSCGTGVKVGVIYMKSTSMDNPSFPTGKGTAFISTNSNTACINNATSTKQTVNAATGLVVLASDKDSHNYLHNTLLLGPGTGTPTTAATNTTTPTTGATNTPTATPVPGSTATATSTPTTPPSSGTRLKDITFESGSLTDPSTGADAVLDSVSLNNSTPLKGAYSATINTTSGYLREDFSATDDVYVSVYVKFTSFPANARLVQISNGSTTVGTIFVTTSGTLQLKNGTTTIGTSAQILTAGTLYRIGLHQKKGTGSDALLEAYLATGDAAFTTPFASNATQSFSTQATRLSVGATNSNAVNATVDDIRIDTGAMP
jgi:hypothetical protein